VKLQHPESFSTCINRTELGERNIFPGGTTRLQILDRLRIIELTPIER
jgi:hypothetical protein